MSPPKTVNNLTGSQASYNVLKQEKKKKMQGMQENKGDSAVS